jgi:hypothetical protein
VPIIADYAELEPVLAKALNKVAAKGIDVPSIGVVKVKFGPPRLYATENGRLALGLAMAARGPRQVLDTKGTVWLTAKPETMPDSEKLLIRDVQMATGVSGAQFQLLVDIAESEVVQDALEDALTQDFSRDYLKLMAKIDVALKAVRVGPFRLTATLTDMHHGTAQALGQGLYLPVVSRGTARLDFAPSAQGRLRGPGRRKGAA